MSAYPTFPELSRSPSLKTKTTTDDPTLRDTMENGLVTTRARFRRRRRSWTVTIMFLTAADVVTLDNFVENVAVFGVNIFLFPDTRDPSNPTAYPVRFSKLPTYDDADWIQDQFRQNTTFEIAEV